VEQALEASLLCPTQIDARLWPKAATAVAGIGASGRAVSGPVIAVSGASGRASSGLWRWRPSNQKRSRVGALDRIASDSGEVSYDHQF
jgi:hypothetical protein